MKKAQITIFIIIGILILIAFGTTIYVASKVKKIEKPKTPQLQTQTIQDYITSCLEIATKEGLTILGKQGGYIYVSQGGLNNIPKFTVKYTDQELGVIDIPFIVTPPQGNVGTSNCATPDQKCGEQGRPECCLFYSKTPHYPFTGFPYLPDGNEFYQGYYGMNELPPLYKKTPDDKPVSNSIQENLEQYIAKRTAECTNWETYKDYNINAGTPKASLIFAEKKQIEKFIEVQALGEKYITIELEWPVEITSPSGEKTILTNFATKEPVRLVTIYFTVKQILDADVTDISYTPKDIDSFTVNSLKDGENSIIIIKDAQSKIENKPYEFWAARKNRAPAIWQINTEPLNEMTFHVKEDSGATITIEGNKLIIKDICQDPDKPDPYIIELKATDPDENKITYEATPKEIPGETVLGKQVSIRVYAKDESTNQEEWYDYQDIPIQVALCPVR
ncbi:hypothetical protein KY319_02815 [Candidatus Woesearchaeota archaeon]|nr:hypothetical protein [Candidatus Woesearchaeota archaeon]